MPDASRNAFHHPQVVESPVFIVANSVGGLSALEAAIARYVCPSNGLSVRRLSVQGQPRMQHMCCTSRSLQRVRLELLHTTCLLPVQEGPGQGCSTLRH